MSLTDSSSKQIRIEITYAKPDIQWLQETEVVAGTNLLDATRQSGITARFPEIDLDTVKMGIFGKIAKADRILQEGDRIEIYRPLIADPKEARKKRAAKAAESKSANTGKKIKK